MDEIAAPTGCGDCLELAGRARPRERPCSPSGASACAGAAT